MGYKCNLGDLKEIYTEEFWNWDKSDGIENYWNSYLVLDKCAESKKELWLDLGKCTWSKHRGIFQDHLKYIRNDIVKPFCVGIICYAERVQEMHDIEKYLPPSSMKSEIFDEASWKVHGK